MAIVYVNVAISKRERNKHDSLCKDNLSTIALV